MIITKLHLKRFGRHQDLLFNSNASVVGLVGPNGSGKSTVMTAVEFAITGEAEDNLDTYVYNYDGNASVELEFIKNGKKGNIFRQVGKTSKRWIEYDGKKKSAAKEVDALMAEIFGADKKAIANAVFITQGELEKMLFLKGADRRDMFIKMVNLSFCSKNAKILDGKIAKLQDTVVDLTAARDQALEQRRVSTENMEARKKELEQCSNWEEEIKFLDSQERTRREIEFIEVEIGRLRNESVVLNEQLKHLYQDCSVLSLEQARFDEQSLSNKLEEITDRVGCLRSTAAEFVHYDRVESEIQNGLKTLTALEQKLKECNPENLTLEDWTKYALQLESDIQKLNRRSALISEINRLLESEKRHGDALRMLTKPATDRERIPTLEHELQKARTQKVTLERSLALDDEIKTCFAGLDMTKPQECPKCGLKVSGNRPLPQDERDALLDLVGEVEKQIVQLTTTLNTARLEWSNHDKEQSRIAGLIDAVKVRLKEALNERDAIVVDGDVTTKGNEVARIRQDVIGVLLHNPGQQEREKLALAKKMQEKATYKLAAANNRIREAFSADVINRTVTEQGVLKVKLDGFSPKVREMARMENEVTRIKRDTDTQHSRIAPLATKLQDVPSARLVELAVQMNNDWAAVKAELNTRQGHRNTLQGRLTEAESSYAGANKQYHDICDRMAKDEEKLKVIAELVRVKELLSDDGLPSAFVKYQFQHLSRITQEGLVKLNPNFSIEIDPDEPISYLFKRLDSTDAVLLPMTKLSGGQKVRLCVAFLMAVQKRLVKDVGLLVLDEITVHLDEEGIDNVVLFIKDFGEQLANTEMQVWLVDHNPKLRMCLGACAELSNKEETKKND